MRKTISIITFVCFFLTSCLGEVFVGVCQAQGLARPMIAPVSAYEQFDVEAFHLPRGLGEIKDAWKTSSIADRDERVVIHIQDAHCNYGAQKKIADIIEYLRNNYGVSTINLEGGEGAYDFAEFTDIQDKIVREKVSDYFVRQGLVSGAEYYAINNAEESSVKLWGVEDTGLYLKNLNVYKDFLMHKEDSELYLEQIESVFNVLKKKIYSEPLLKFDEKYTGYKEGVLELKDYIAFLSKNAREKNIDTKRFPNVYLLAKSLETEMNIDFKRAEKEREILIFEAEKRFSKNSLRVLLEKLAAFKNEEESRENFYKFLIRKAKTANIDTKRFPELNKYIEYITLYNSMDKTRLMKEMERLAREIKETMYENDKQRKFDRLSKTLILTKNLFNIQLSKEDYNYYKSHKADFAAKKYIPFIEKEASLHKIDAKFSKNIRDLDKWRKNLSRFYEYSTKRDRVFIRNIRDSRVRGNDKEEENDNSPLSFPRKRESLPPFTVLITGGFHTENLSALFKKNNISYITVMPNFKNAKDYESQYFNLLVGKQLDTLKKLTAATSNLALYTDFCENVVKVYSLDEMEAKTLWRKLAQAVFEEKKDVSIHDRHYSFQSSNDAKPIKGIEIDGKQVYAKTIFPQDKKKLSSVSTHSVTKKLFKKIKVTIALLLTGLMFLTTGCTGTLHIRDIFGAVGVEIQLTPKDYYKLRKEAIKGNIHAIREMLDICQGKIELHEQFRMGADYFFYIELNLAMLVKKINNADEDADVVAALINDILGWFDGSSSERKIIKGAIAVRSIDVTKIIQKAREGYEFATKTLQELAFIREAAYSALRDMGREPLLENFQLKEIKGNLIYGIAFGNEGAFNNVAALVAEGDIVAVEILNGAYDLASGGLAFVEGNIRKCFKDADIIPFEQKANGGGRGAFISLATFTTFGNADAYNSLLQFVKAGAGAAVDAIYDNVLNGRFDNEASLVDPIKTDFAGLDCSLFVTRAEANDKGAVHSLGKFAEYHNIAAYNALISLTNNYGLNDSSTGSRSWDTISYLESLAKRPREFPQAMTALETTDGTPYLKNLRQDFNAGKTLLEMLAFCGNEIAFNHLKDLYLNKESESFRNRYSYAYFKSFFRNRSLYLRQEHLEEGLSGEPLKQEMARISFNNDSFALYGMLISRETFGEMADMIFEELSRQAQAQGLSLNDFIKSIDPEKLFYKDFILQIANFNLLDVVCSETFVFYEVMDAVFKELSPEELRNQSLRLALFVEDILGNENFAYQEEFQQYLRTLYDNVEGINEHFIATTLVVHKTRFNYLNQEDIDTIANKHDLGDLQDKLVPYTYLFDKDGNLNVHIVFSDDDAVNTHYSLTSNFFKVRGYGVISEEKERIILELDNVRLTLIKANGGQNYDINEESLGRSGIIISRSHAGNERKVFNCLEVADDTTFIGIMSSCRSATVVGQVLQDYPEASFISVKGTGRGEDTNKVTHRLIEGLKQKPDFYSELSNFVKEGLEPTIEDNYILPFDPAYKIAEEVERKSREFEKPFSFSIKQFDEHRREEARGDASTLFAYAEGMALENPQPISKNGIEDIGGIKESVMPDAARLTIGKTTVHIDNDLIRQYRAFGFEDQKFFVEFLNGFFADEISARPIIQKELVISVLDTAGYLFEDHLANGFIGIHRSLFEKLGSTPQTARELLAVGLKHELAHEALFMEREVLSANSLNADEFTGRNRADIKKAMRKIGLWEEVEKRMLEEDIKNAEKMGLNIQEIISSGLLSESAPFARGMVELQFQKRIKGERDVSWESLYLPEFKTVIGKDGKENVGSMAIRLIRSRGPMPQKITGLAIQYLQLKNMLEENPEDREIFSRIVYAMGNRLGLIKAEIEEILEAGLILRSFDQGLLQGKKDILHYISTFQSELKREKKYSEFKAKDINLRVKSYSWRPAGTEHYPLPSSMAEIHKLAESIAKDILTTNTSRWCGSFKVWDKDRYYISVKDPIERHLEYFDLFSGTRRTADEMAEYKKSQGYIEKRKSIEENPDLIEVFRDLNSTMAAEAGHLVLEYMLGMCPDLSIHEFYDALFRLGMEKELRNNFVQRGTFRSLMRLTRSELEQLSSHDKEMYAKFKSKRWLEDPALSETDIENLLLEKISKSFPDNRFKAELLNLDRQRDRAFFSHSIGAGMLYELLRKVDGDVDLLILIAGRIMKHPEPSSVFKSVPSFVEEFERQLKKWRQEPKALISHTKTNLVSQQNAGLLGPQNIAEIYDGIMKQDDVGNVVGMSENSPITGNIAKGFTPDKEALLRAEILSNSEAVMEANEDVVKVVEERCRRLLVFKGDIRYLLRERGISEMQINRVISALVEPRAMFQWFRAIVEGEERYLLGHESALAVNLVRYLMVQEKLTGIPNLVDEYILHEALENADWGSYKHYKIIGFTSAYLRQKKYRAPYLTPLGKALGAFIDVSVRNKGTVNSMLRVQPDNVTPVELTQGAKPLLPPQSNSKVGGKTGFQPYNSSVKPEFKPLFSDPEKPAEFEKLFPKPPIPRFETTTFVKTHDKVKDRKAVTIEAFNSEPPTRERDPIAIVGLPAWMKGEVKLLNELKRDISRVLGRAGHGKPNDPHKVDFFFMGKNKPKETKTSITNILRKYENRKSVLFIPEMPELKIKSDSAYVRGLEEEFEKKLTIVSDAYTDLDFSEKGKVFVDITARIAITRLIGWYKESEISGNSFAQIEAMTALTEYLLKITGEDATKIKDLNLLLKNLLLRISPVDYNGDFKNWEKAQKALATSL